ncbi:MAG: MmgE/PrpD family protein [Mesorhizobium sp.]|nr:MAG: MmgE/PrpD family protein [Mesorhizobium sp.]
MSTAPLYGCTDALARFALDMNSSQLSEPVRHECVRALVDAIGCSLGGSRHSIVEVAYEALREFFGRPTTTLLGRADKADLLHATLLNGLAGAAYSFFDTYSDALLHPGVPVAAGLLGLAERTQASGAQFVSAFATGLEAACRLTKTIALAPAEASISWSQSGIVGGVATALAAGKLLGLDQQRLRWALGIAASQSAGTRADHGTMTASLIFGHAAQTGVRAALLAANGFTSSHASLEDRHGFASVFATKPNFMALVDGLGRDFVLMENTYKPFPCGVVIHPAIDAMLQLKKEAGFSGPDISRIEINATQSAVTFGSRPHPANEIEAKFSLHHWVAAAASRGKAGIAEGASAVVEDKEVARLRGVITLNADPSTPPKGAELLVDLLDGRRVTKSVIHCIGSLERPMSDADLEAKFVDQGGAMIGVERAQDLVRDCWRIMDIPDASLLARKATCQAGA